MVLAQPCAPISDALARREPMGFPVLCDEERAVIRAYGVWDPIGLASLNTAHPATFLVERRTHLIRHAFVGRTQRDRAPLDAILDAAAASD
jgi:peroxiredoxin